VIAAVDKHQALLRASVANVGQDHRLGANEAPPAIISIFLGAELERAFNAVASGKPVADSKGNFLGLGTPVLPPLPLHGGDRNRTSPFAFTGNKFEFRAVGSSSSLGFPNTVLNTIVAESIDEMVDKVEAAKAKGKKGDDAVLEVVKSVWKKNKRIIFGGDNYADTWHKEAAKRGLSNLATTPDALPWLVEKQTIRLFERYEVLSERELESRFEVAVEQYATKLNIEAETAASIARTMILPAAARHINELKSAGLTQPATEAKAATDRLVKSLKTLEKLNVSHPAVEGLEHAKWTRDKIIPAMDATREAADVLERIVADDLWPLPKYSEILFIK
jgi:glutamine synthetase